MPGRKLAFFGLAAIIGLLLAGCGAGTTEPTAIIMAEAVPAATVAAETAPTPGLQPTPTLLPAPRATVTTGTGGLPWWNDRVFYEVFVRSFSDSDGDGIGDLQGLIDRLDYLNDGDPDTGDDLGVTGIWLMPVAQSPSYHGYDVVDYRQIEEDYGTNEDFKRLVEEAHQRGIAVIVDLVLNHTSSEHPWFVEAQEPGSERENWYIWADEPPFATGPWGAPAWHEDGSRYYYGLFWEGMPDLNYRHGAVTEEMYDVAGFWLDEMGVDGFRLDAIQHLVEEGEVQANTPSTRAWLEGFYRLAHSTASDTLLVGEVWTETDQVVEYIGDKVDVAFEFDLAQAILESVWRENRAAVQAAQEKVLEAYPQGQYASFLTNHDQDRVMNQLRDDLEGAKAAATLLLTNPGVPFVYYGEEVGMRGAKPDPRIRTPMQWDGTETAGFTNGTPWEALDAAYETRNVAAQDGDPDSLLSHYQQLIRLRQEHPALRAGDMDLVDSDAQPVYAFLRYTDEEAVLVVINLSSEPVGDYALALERGPLSGACGVTLLLGEGEVSAPVVNAEGGFDGYKPLPTLPPRSSTIIRLAP
jgi:alpha-amylase